MGSVAQISIITGGNRGFGKAVASRLVSAAKLGSVAALDNQPLKNFIILVARDEAQLCEVREALQGEAAGEIRAVAGVELSRPGELQAKLAEIFGLVKAFAASRTFLESTEKRLVLFNNAGSLGDVSKRATQMSPQEVGEYASVNFTSFALFCAEFKGWLSLAPFDVGQIVNTSSLAALEPFAYHSLYCSMKAAREMYLRVVGLEEPALKTLNYAPGPMDNGMQATLRETLGDLGARAHFQTLYDEVKRLVRMEDSAARLLQISFTDAFRSGDHIDFYDDGGLMSLP
ncbi:hypothetical protein L0F63_002667 [Massospora cicadina]|nr:hypothetical protein L0F63_002667 [Massospora cicadina]